VKSRRKFPLAIAGVAFALVAAWASWRIGRPVLIVRHALPSPDLSARPAALVSELDAATHQSRSFFQAEAGLARLAQLYHANGFYDEAIVCYEALVELRPQEPRWPHLIANIESTYGRIPEAVQWEERAIKLAPDAPVAHLRLADFFLKSNRLSEAEAAYLLVHRLQPANPYALLGVARCHLARQDLVGAREFLREAIRVQLDFSPAWALLSSLEEQSGNHETAEAARKHSERRFREVDDPWVDGLTDYCYDAYQLSVAAETSKDRGRARELLERAISLAPDASVYHCQIARMLIAAGEKQAARTHLEHAVKLSPTDSESWSALIALLIELNDQAAGMKALNEALQFCPQSGYLHFLNGNRLMAASRFDAAEQELQTSARLQPAEIRSYIQLSRLYVSTNRFSSALMELNRALAADPANLMVLNLLARLTVMTGDADAAARWIHQVRSRPETDRNDLGELTTLFRQQFGHDPF
jgi:tetratricopeptide (TPR) repeat protein